MNQFTNPEIKNSAYSKSPKDMSTEELGAILITSDGKGVNFKEECFLEILSRKHAESKS